MRCAGELCADPLGRVWYNFARPRAGSAADQLHGVQPGLHWPARTELHLSVLLRMQ